MAYDKVASGLNNFKNKRWFLGNKFSLKLEKTYTTPTGFGLAFAITMLILLSMAIVSGNNLLYLFVFACVSIALSGAFISNKNINSITILDIHSSLLFANEKNTVVLNLKNNNLHTTLYDIAVLGNNLNTQSQITFINKAQIYNAEVEWKPEQRGYHSLPVLTLQSLFPFSMLRVWKKQKSSQKFLVYPERKGDENIEPYLNSNEDQKNIQSQHYANQQQDSFKNHREFQAADSPKRIDWKKSTKHQKHFVKNFESDSDEKILIDWKMTSHLVHIEDKISQLALWIDICYKKNQTFSLKIKDEQTEYSNQLYHYKECMQWLALLDPKDIL